MALPNYSSDLVDIISDMPNTTGWTLISSGGGGPNSLTAPETDYFIQGSSCISRNPFSSSIRGMVYNAGTITIPSGDAVFYWVWAGVPNAIDTESNGGIQCLLGNTTTNLKAYYVRGSDTYAYGGWVCVPIDPNETSDINIGSPTSVTSIFGARWNVPSTGPSRGFPFAIDAIRYGRTITIINGEIDNYATFSGTSLENDNQNNRWGLFQAIDGGYLHQGLIQLGTSSNLVDFRDSNVNISIANTKKVNSNFNGFEVNNINSNIEWTNIQITSLGSTSKGYFLVNDNATIIKNLCVFTNMNTFTYQSNTIINDVTYRLCNNVIQNGATFNNCIFDRSSDTRTLLSNVISNLNNCDFISSGVGHAIEGFASAGTYSLNNIFFNNYATLNGSTGNEALYITATSGVVDINIIGGSIPSYRTDGATVNIIVPDITITIVGNVSLIDAEIRIYDLDATLPFKGTELAGIENNDSPTFTFSESEGNQVWIQIMKSGYEEFGLIYTIPSNNTILNISLTLDINA